jgi:hypothetical protein
MVSESPISDITAYFLGIASGAANAQAANSIRKIENQTLNFMRFLHQ